MMDSHGGLEMASAAASGRVPQRWDPLAYSAPLARCIREKLSHAAAEIAGPWLRLEPLTEPMPARPVRWPSTKAVHG